MVPWVELVERLGLFCFGCEFTMNAICEVLMYSFCDVGGTLTRCWIIIGFVLGLVGDGVGFVIGFCFCF